MKNHAVITGDIIGSRSIKPEIWLKELKAVLGNFGKEKTDWEIFRGDSFQLLTETESAFRGVFIIKSTIKSIKNLDVRLAVGIGEIDFQAKKITESNGSAFVRSGESFENLKKSTIAIHSANVEFDEFFNVGLDLAAFISESWQPATAEVVKNALLNPDLNQTELAQKLNKKSQGTISSALKRSGFDEISELIKLYQKEVRKL
jgi:hypothetical protein